LLRQRKVTIPIVIGTGPHPHLDRAIARARFKTGYNLKIA
jgi:hypothetical protein